MKKIIFILGASYILTSCGVPQADYDQLLAQNDTLKAQVDELMNGEERLVAIIESSFASKEYEVTKTAILKLKETHPQSDFIEKSERISIEILSTEEVIAKKMEAEAKEKKRIENLNNTGIWQVTHYVDEFGEPTQEGVIRNLNLIDGLFSNSATENSKLTVRILIENSKDVAIILYEYAGNNPVKSYSPDKYRVLVRAANGERHKLNATNYGDRLSFGPQHSKIIYDTLVMGGEVKFHIIETKTPTNQYDFSIKKSDYIDNALRLMAEKPK